jgi:hypothetical protein
VNSQKIAEPPNPPEVAPDEALAVVPSDDEPEDNEKVRLCITLRLMYLIFLLQIINAAPGKELKAVPDDDGPEDDTEVRFCLT